MQNSFIATAMKKHSIANGEAIYSVVETVVGTYDPGTKLFTDENPTKIRIAIMNGNDIVYRSTFTRILEEEKDVFVKAGINIKDMNENYRLKIYVDDDLLYSELLKDVIQ